MDNEKLNELRYYLSLFCSKKMILLLFIGTQICTLIQPLMMGEFIDRLNAKGDIWWLLYPLILMLILYVLSKIFSFVFEWLMLKATREFEQKLIL